MKHPEYWSKWTKVYLKKGLRKSKVITPVWVFMGALTIFALGEVNWKTSKLSHWNKPTSQGSTHFERVPANDQCSDFNLNEIQAENMLLEKSQFAHHLTGSWEHLSFKELPFRDAAFLYHFKPTLTGEQKNSIKSCHRAKCILENLTSSSEMSSVVWNWYLKTGIILNPIGFSASEMKELWQLSQKLPDAYFHQDDVKLISKVTSEDSQCFAYKDQTILINEMCPDILMVVTTALTQRFLPKWLKAFPQWKNALTKPKNTPALWSNQVWSRSLQEEKYLAKEISLYLIHGEARELTKSFLQDHLFQQKWGKEFEVKKQFQADLWSWRQQRSQSVKDCLDLHRSAFTQKSPRRSIASLAEPHPLTQCVRNSGAQTFLKERRQWLMQSSMACRWRQPETEETLKTYYQKLQTIVAKDIDQLEWKIFANGMNWLHEFQTKEMAILNIDPTQSYFRCRGAASEKACYDQDFSAKLRSRIPASASEELLEDYSYDSLQEKLKVDLALKGEWLKLHFVQEARNVWKKCWSRGTQEMAKIKNPLTWVSPGAEYVDARFAHCLDQQSEELVMKIFPKNDTESAFWKKSLREPIRSYWKQEIAQESQKEMNWLTSHAEVMKQKLIFDLKKHMQLSVTFEPKEACLRRLSFHYPTPLYFHSRFQLNAEFGSQMCASVLEGPDMNKSMSRHRENRWNVLGKELKFTLVGEWEQRVRKYCLGRVPASQVQSLLESESMKGCIRDQFELAWPISANEVGLKFSLPGESLDEFKSDIKAISQAVLQEKLRQ